MKKLTLPQVALYIILILLALISTYVENGIWKQIANFLAVVGTIYTITSQIFPKSIAIKYINEWLRKTPLGFLIPEDESESLIEGYKFFKFKSELLEFTTSEIKKRNTLVINPDIFCFDFFTFEEFSEFIPGSKQVNKTFNWEDRIDRQFSFITGSAGSGKTFELIKRAEYACSKLSYGLDDYNKLEKVKIPIYIELKSLDQEIDKDWIVDYLLKTSQISKFKLSKFQIREIVDKDEVIYFFDGIDEIVDVRHREDCVKKIVNIFSVTGVQATCRKQFYDEFVNNNNIIPVNNKPSELSLKPLDKLLIGNIISALPNRTEENKKEMKTFALTNAKLLDRLSQSIFLNLFVIIYPTLSVEEKNKLAFGEMNVLWRNYEDIIAKNKLPKDVDVLGLRTFTIWIAKIMEQKPFNVESIQPNWLWKVLDNGNVAPSPQLQRLYFVCTRVISSIIVGIAMGCILATPFSLIPASIIGGFTIACLAGIYNYKRINNIKEKESSKMKLIFTNGLFSLVMITSLVIFCGAYQGISTPRHPNEMTTPYFSMAECWSGILLGICLSTIFSYRIIMERDRDRYILPIEIFHFDWGHAIKYGLFWGTSTGLITGSIAIYVKNHFKNAILIKSWLIPYLNRVAINLGIGQISEKDQDTAVFVYAFCVAFFVASIIIILMAGRFNDVEETDVKKKQELNFGIFESGKQAAAHAGKIAILGCAIYYLIMLRIGIGHWYFCIKIAVGISILSFLWFGGMEVINHRFLRFNLFTRRIAPLDYKPWVHNLQLMGLLVPTGYQLKFYHTTLTDYYIDYSVQNNSRIRIKTRNYKDTILYIFLLILFIICLITPLVKQYLLHSFWKDQYDITIRFRGIIKDDTDNNHSYCVVKKGIYKLSTGGYSNVGTFVGYARPIGTEFGFMGMPIDSAYNLPGLEKYRHAALLYRIQSNDGKWSSFDYASGKDSLELHQGDRLQFIVNDKEFQNNLGRYTLEISTRTNDKSSDGQ